MPEITAEFNCASNSTKVNVQINEFMDEWGEENMGHLTVNGLHGFDKIYPGDQLKGSFVLVVFEINPPSEAEILIKRHSR